MVVSNTNISDLSGKADMGREKSKPKRKKKTPRKEKKSARDEEANRD